MIKKIIIGFVIILAMATLWGRIEYGIKKMNGELSPTIVDGRYAIEEQNEFVTKFTDLKTNKVQWRTDDGQETDWFDNTTTWEEACTTWDDI